jgi:hypothetical protein
MSKTEPSAESACASLMHEYEELRANALAMGGPEKLARRKAFGVLNAR